MRRYRGPSQKTPALRGSDHVPDCFPGTGNQVRLLQVIVVDSLQEAWLLADEYASEHVEIFTQNPRDALTNMSNHGALFLGEKTCVSYGDKVIGTNHVLPTRKASRYTGGLWVGKYLRTCTYQEVTSENASGELGRLCGRAARAENFEGHARSGDLRAQRYLKDKFEWIAEEGSEVPQLRL